MTLLERSLSWHNSLYAFFLWKAVQRSELKFHYESRKEAHSKCMSIKENPLADECELYSQQILWKIPGKFLPVMKFHLMFMHVITTGENFPLSTFTIILEIQFYMKCSNFPRVVNLERQFSFRSEWNVCEAHNLWRITSRRRLIDYGKFNNFSQSTLMR